MTQFIVLSFTALVASTGFTAPVPATSTSRIVSANWGLFQSPEGFALDARGSAWQVSEIPEGAENAEAAYRIPLSKSLLTIRVDEAKRARQPKAYMESWMTLYHRLGFDILGTRPFEQNGDTAYVVDMIQKDKSKQARQAIFFRNNKAIIISCHDEIEPFKKSLNECNKVIRSFRWNRTENPTPKY